VLEAPAVLSLPLGVAAFVMADRDLDWMGDGLLDPSGREETWAAHRRACNAMALNIVGPCVCLVLCCGVLRVLSSFL
jgi:hypothetical protein